METHATKATKKLRNSLSVTNEAFEAMMKEHSEQVASLEAQLAEERSDRAAKQAADETIIRLGVKVDIERREVKMLRSELTAREAEGKERAKLKLDLAKNAAELKQYQQALNDTRQALQQEWSARDAIAKQLVESEAENEKRNQETSTGSVRLALLF